MEEQKNTKGGIMLNSKKELMTMRSRLEDILSQGIELYLDGQPSSPTVIAERFVMEDVVYMPDFVISEDGVLTQVRYDRVREN